MNRICALISEHIKRFGVEQEGLSLLGATATTFGKVFEERANKFWMDVWNGLTLYNNDASTFKAALSCIGDFARSL